MMVELYIGSFCEDLKKRVQHNPLQINTDQYQSNLDNNHNPIHQKNNISKTDLNNQKIFIEEPKSTTREIVDKLNTERVQNEKFESYNRNIKNNEYLSNALERTEEALEMLSPDPEIKPTKISHTSFNDVYVKARRHLDKFDSYQIDLNNQKDNEANVQNMNINQKYG